LFTVQQGNAVFASGGELVWEINQADGTAGDAHGWDLLAVSAQLNITATAANPFTIALRTLEFADAAGLPVNFDPTTGYRFTFVTAGTGISGFSPEVFALDVSGVTSAITGTWSIDFSASGGGLDLIYAANTSPIPEPSTYALLAGLVVLGVVMKRRRRAR
jgi:hypothetical protein